MEPNLNRKMRRAMTSKQNKIKHRIRTYRCYWDGVFLPTWVIRMQYSAIIWAAYHVTTANGKSRLKKRQFENKSSWKVATGGCAGLASNWADPPLGPPSFLRLLDPCVPSTQDANGARGELQC